MWSLWYHAHMITSSAKCRSNHWHEHSKGRVCIILRNNTFTIPLIAWNPEMSPGARHLQSCNKILQELFRSSKNRKSTIKKIRCPRFRTLFSPTRPIHYSNGVEINTNLLHTTIPHSSLPGITFNQFNYNLTAPMPHSHTLKHIKISAV